MLCRCGNILSRTKHHHELPITEPVTPESRSIQEAISAWAPSSKNLPYFARPNFPFDLPSESNGLLSVYSKSKETNSAPATDGSSAIEAVKSEQASIIPAPAAPPSSVSTYEEAASAVQVASDDHKQSELQIKPKE